METGFSKITVRFQDPFWVCLYERGGAAGWEACQIPFGAEPGDAQVYAFLLDNWRSLPFGPPVDPADPPPDRRLNPKRARREARKAVRPAAMGTKAQQALALQREEGKAARTRKTRAEREAEEARKFALRQEKRREKRKGH